MVPATVTDNSRTPAEVLSSQLRRRREESRLSQAALAQAIGSTQASVARLEAGQSSASLDAALALAVVLSVWPGDLFLPRDTEPPVELAGLTFDPWDARLWLQGRQMLPGHGVIHGEPDSLWGEVKVQYVREQARGLADHARALVSATLREDRGALADAVDALNQIVKELEATVA